ncbi:MAG: hypothetical protein F6K56_19920 [Moorea sp. SIO3G5]|nr:hypothetical protein [Moorena sp. SIO3G5]
MFALWKPPRAPDSRLPTPDSRLPTPYSLFLYLLTSQTKGTSFGNFN